MAKLHKAVHLLTPNEDDSDAPVFRLMLTDSEVNRKMVALKNECIEMQAFIDKCAAMDDWGEDDYGKTIELWRTVIVSVTDEDFYQAVVDYVREGEEIEDGDMILLLTPLVVEILDLMNDVLSLNRNKAYERYLRESSKRTL